MSDTITKQYADTGPTQQKPANGSLMDLRRKAQIVGGKPNDHEGEVFLVVLTTCSYDVISFVIILRL